MNVYQSKIQSALSYIEKNLEKNLLWDEIASYCAISKYHFHRIFSSYMKETPGDYIKRRRLEKSVLFLCYTPSLDLVNVALKSGYSSQANFSKAFKIHFGVTPKEVRSASLPKNSKMGRIKSKYGKDFYIHDLYPSDVVTNEMRDGMNEVKIKKFRERKLIYKTSREGYLKPSIEVAWEEVLNSINSLPKKRQDIEMLGICYDNPQVTPIDRCRYDACIVIDETHRIEKSLATMNLPAGNFACFPYKGERKELTNFYLNIYSKWLLNCSYELGDFPIIERYLNTNLENGKIELEAQFLLHKGA